MSKHNERRKVGPSKDREVTPAVVYLAAVGTALVAYFIAEVALGAKPHPIHWAALVGGGLLGIPLGWLWYRWRGDII